MFKVVGCFVEAHDLRLVLLAAAVCTLSAFTVVALLNHGRKIAGRLKALWLGIAALAGGSGIWATHFVAMLAYAPGVASAYNLHLTVLSLVEAIALCGIGFTIGVLANDRLVAMVGGAVVGGGIAVMHFTGMAAFEVAGRITWDLVVVSVSIALGAFLGAVALSAAVRSQTQAGRLSGAVLLVLAICSLHFTAMGALTIVPDPQIAISDAALPTSWLALAVALATFALLLLAGAALGIDIRDRRQASLEGERLRSLANAAIEGLAVCKGDTIATANKSFAKLVGLDPEAVSGRTLSEFLVNPASRLTLAAAPEQPVEAELRRTDGTSIPVEIIMQPVEYTNEPHYAVAVRDLRARRRAEGQIRFLAHHDPLTGLADRTRFNERIEQELQAAQEAGRKLAVLCLDLDRFKEVNDLFGHAAGDALLETVARTLKGLADDTQIVARLGGDEFAILVPCESAAEAGHLAEQIIDALRSGSADQKGPQIATSIGIALYPNDATERQTLLTHADTALYRAKSEGRGTYRFFEATMGAQVHERRLIEHDLRYAIARDEIRLVYQPQHDVGSGELTGFEALIRWRHPKRGQVSPSVFIPIAEESGLILQIGEWVLREACREAARWDKPLSIAVNVSTVQIHATSFAALVHETLLATGLAPHRLELEITETALVRDQVRAVLTLRQLKALGVRIAMDDFGTGYSSLSNLRAFAFDKIKIDASFIKSVEANSQAAAIVRSVLSLGRGLGVPVLAEGVETEAQLHFLRAEDCDAVQGYFLGRPVPIEQFSHVLEPQPKETRPAVGLDPEDLAA